MKQSSTNLLQRSQNEVQPSLGERCVRWMRQRYPARTADNIAADTGLKTETIRSMMHRESDPSSAVLIALIAVYGPDFLFVAIPNAPDWLCREHRRLEREALVLELNALKARIDASMSADLIRS